MSTYDRPSTGLAHRPQQGRDSDSCYCPSVDRVVSTTKMNGGDESRRAQWYWGRQMTSVVWADASKGCFEESPIARVTRENHPRLAGNMVDGWEKKTQRVDE